MTIVPQFQINSLVQHKYQKASDIESLSDMKMAVKFMEVIYIHTETCSAGTQVFYIVRPFYPIIKTSFKKDVEAKVVDLAFAAGELSSNGTLKLREDELKAMSLEERTFYGI